ncbi:Conserved hypothetical secreted protein [Brachyspira suanatina]|uniref:Conserved hypothetical secreted protein n=1 Tax=Brachyspira suanatina TaxID=381802 RepID=A0A0G4K439_9SPIR|nr:hypothetical protein [Brachyspira suanatina]CRF31858.1 Conserved hypothetical secreted protein [Brachyspira suanatina]
MKRKRNIFKLLFILLTLSLFSLSCSMLDVTGSDEGIEKEYRGNRYSGDLIDESGVLSKAEISINSDGSFDLNLNGTVRIEAKNIISLGNGKYTASQGTSGFDLQFSSTSLDVTIVYYDNGKQLSGTLTKQ